MTRIDWIEKGREHWDGQQEAIKAICGRIEWQALPCTMAMMPGEAIKTIVREMRMPKVSHVGYSVELAPYGLISIRAHYKNGDVDLFAVDEGVSIVPICAFVDEKGG